MRLCVYYNSSDCLSQQVENKFGVPLAFLFQLFTITAVFLRVIFSTT